MRANRYALAVVACVALGGCSVVSINHSLTEQRYRRAGLREHTVELPSGSMHYWAGGAANRETVVLLHGFGFGALETWAPQIALLARQYRVIAPDLYWFGESRPRVVIETARAQADAIAELLARLDAPAAHVVGMSFGGFVAIELALAQPQRVSRLVLVDAAGLPPTADERAQIAATFGNAPTIADVLIPADTNALRVLLDGVLYRHRWVPRFVGRQILAQELWLHRDEKRRMLDALMRPGGTLPEARLAAITMPTLVIWGRHDRLLLPSIGQRLAAAIPGAELQWMEQSGHAAMLEEPGRFAFVLLQFLRAK